MVLFLIRTFHRNNLSACKGTKPVLINDEFRCGMNKKQRRILSEAQRPALPSLALGPCMSLLFASRVFYAAHLLQRAETVDERLRKLGRAHVIEPFSEEPLSFHWKEYRISRMKEMSELVFLEAL